MFFFLTPSNPHCPIPGYHLQRLLQCGSPTGERASHLTHTLTGGQNVHCGEAKCTAESARAHSRCHTFSSSPSLVFLPDRPCPVAAFCHCRWTFVREKWWLTPCSCPRTSPIKLPRSCNEQHTPTCKEPAIMIQRPSGMRRTAGDIDCASNSTRSDNRTPVQPSDQCHGTVNALQLEFVKENAAVLETFKEKVMKIGVLFTRIGVSGSY